jgi:hypothetical protein
MAPTSRILAALMLVLLKEGVCERETHKAKFLARLLFQKF